MLAMSSSPLVTRSAVTELLRRADAEGFAVPAFNYSDIWDFLAIIEAADALKSPVYLASTERVVGEIGVELCGAIGLAATRKSSGFLVHHLDHCHSPQLCFDAIDNGYPSVMIDASMYTLKKNETLVVEVAVYAHRHNVAVEGEVGRIKGVGFEGSNTDTDSLATVQDVVHFVRETGVDSLAVGIGTAHGFYKERPAIDFELLREIDRAVDVPLVLHGGTGLPSQDVRLAIENGINKVNIGTIVHCTYMNEVRAQLMEKGENCYTLDVMKPARNAVCEVVKDWIRVCGADGKL